jgi:hypothetical protein
MITIFIIVLEGRSKMVYVKKILPIAAVALLLTAIAPSARAVDDSDWPTTLHVPQPLYVGKMLLSPGTYILQRYSGVSRSVVMIYNLDDDRWCGMVIGIPADRTIAAADSGFEIYRNAQGTHEELRYWHRRGWRSGIEFPSSSGSSSPAASISASAPEQRAYLSK